MNYAMQYQPPQHLQTPEQKQWGLLMHLSQFLNFIVPFGGIIAPVVMWQVKKDEMPAIDAHGKMIVNWIISSVIYTMVSIPLMLVLVGFLTIFAVIVLSIIFPIIGAIKANNGEFWEYPLTIKFLK